MQPELWRDGSGMVLHPQMMAQSHLRLGVVGGCVRSCIPGVQFRQDNYLAESELDLSRFKAKDLPSQHLFAGDGEDEEHAERAQLLWRTEEEISPSMSIPVEQDMVVKRSTVISSR